MSFRQGLAAALLLGFTALPAWAAEYYVAPKGAQAVSNPDGTRERPFASVYDAVNSKLVTGGDIIKLLDGRHGFINLYQVSYETPVVIESASGRGAVIDGIGIKDRTRNITFRNLGVWPSNPDGVSAPLIASHVTSSDIVLENLDVRSEEYASDYMNWDLAKWQARSFVGVELRGVRSLVKGSHFTGLGFPIVIWGSDSVVSDNVINGFAGDGARVLGDRSVFSDNRISDCFKINENHDDGFQSWRNDGDGSVDGLRIERNVILEWTGSQGHPLRCQLQGIGLFDGYFDELVVSNNLISVSLYHGLSVYGARGASIINNTVVHADGAKERWPWLGVFDHKNGVSSSEVVVANNLAMGYNGSSFSKSLVVANRVIMDPTTDFGNIFQFDFFPTGASGFIDLADPSYAPAVDIQGNRRPSGSGPDLGAYEVISAPTVTEQDFGGTPVTGTAMEPTAPTSHSSGTTDTTTSTESSGWGTIYASTSISTTTSTAEGTSTSGTTSTTGTTGTDTSTVSDGSTETTVSTTPTSGWGSGSGRAAGKWSKPRK